MALAFISRLHWLLEMLITLVLLFNGKLLCVHEYVCMHLYFHGTLCVLASDNCTHLLYFTGCLQLLEILEISWNFVLALRKIYNSVLYFAVSLLLVLCLRLVYYDKTPYVSLTWIFCRKLVNCLRIAWQFYRNSKIRRLDRCKKNTGTLLNVFCRSGNSLAWICRHPVVWNLCSGSFV